MPKRVNKTYKIVIGECLSCGWSTKKEADSDNVNFIKHLVEKELKDHLAENGHSRSNIRVLERSKTEKAPTEIESALANRRRAEKRAKERKKSHDKLANLFMAAELNEMSNEQNKALMKSKAAGEWTAAAKAKISNHILRKFEERGFLDSD